MTSITEGKEKIKFPEDSKETEERQGQKRRILNALFVISAFVLVAGVSFGLGRLSTIEEQKIPVKVENLEDYEFLVSDTQRESGEEGVEKLEKEQNLEGEVAGASDGEVVGSKNSDVYHFPWCPGAQRITEDNLLRFASVEEARAAGYRPATNCKGLE